MTFGVQCKNSSELCQWKKREHVCGGGFGNPTYRSRQQRYRQGLVARCVAAETTVPISNSIVVRPAKTIGGIVDLPGSKSLSNRVLLLAAMCTGCVTQVDNLLESDDITYMVAALQQMNVNVEWDREGRTATVQGAVNGVLGDTSATEIELFLGNAGTAMRPLTAAVAAMGNAGTTYILDGVPRMRERPIEDLVNGLKQLGVDCECTLGTGCPPVKVSGGKLEGGLVRLSGAVSSQFLSAILMAAPLATSDVEVVMQDELISKPYVSMTCKLMRRFGVTVEHDSDFSRFYVRGQQQYSSNGSAFVEGDASSASYFLAGAACTGGKITVNGCGSESIQGDVNFARVLEQMGAAVEWTSTSVTVAGPERGGLKGIDIDMNAMPDAAMTLAVAALFAEGQTAIRGVGSWRVKETERMIAICTELRKLGAEVEEGPDFCVITPPEGPLKSVAIDTYDDHRMAMAFALAGACGTVPVTINDPSCTKKTFPDYFDRLEAVITR